MTGLDLRSIARVRNPARILERAFDPCARLSELEWTRRGRGNVVASLGPNTRRSRTHTIPTWGPVTALGLLGGSQRLVPGRALCPRVSILHKVRTMYTYTGNKTLFWCTSNTQIKNHKSTDRCTGLNSRPRIKRIRPFLTSNNGDVDAPLLFMGKMLISFHMGRKKTRLINHNKSCI